MKLLYILLLFFATVTHGQVVKHSYRFYDNLSASTSELGPDLTPEKSLGNCSPLSVASGNFICDSLPQCNLKRRIYHTNLHWGLKYTNTTGVINSTYTIHLYLKLTKGGSPWSRIIDFSNGVSDDGIYFKNVGSGTSQCIDFDPTQIVGPCPYFNLATYYLLTFTRNGQTGVVDVYVDDKLFTSYTDRAGRYVSVAGKPIYIFRDDREYGCESGEANFAYLSFTNQYSSQTAVAAVYKEICSVANVPVMADFLISPNPVCSSTQALTITYTGDKLIPETNYLIDWDWDGGRVLSGTGLGPYKVIWPTSGNKNITLTLKNTACGESLTKTKKVLIGPLTLEASTQKGACSTGSSGVIVANASGGSPPYQYSIDSINYQSANTFNVSPRSYLLYAKDANNCTVSRSVTVETENNVSLQALRDTTICQGQSVKLITVSNATQFSWTPSISLDDPTNKEPLVTPSVSTSYIVTATINTCSKKDTVRVTVVERPTLMLTSSAKSCGRFSLSANSNGLVQWFGPDLNELQIKQDTLVVQVNGQAIYKVRATSPSKGSCFIEKELHLNFSQPAPYRLANNIKSVCGLTTNLDAAPLGVWDQLIWQLPNGAIVNQPTISAQTSGLYVVLASSSSTGCESRDTVTVSLGSIPPSPTVQNKSICAGQPVPALTAIGTTIHWYSDSTLRDQVGAGNSFTPLVSSAQEGFFVYYLTQTLSNNCVSSASKVQLEIKKSPKIHFANKQYLGCFSDGSTDIIILDAGRHPGITYRWATLNDSLVGTTQTVGIRKAGLYQINFINEQQCSHTDTVLVEEVCQPSLFAPTTFTPNGDNINDLFEVKGSLTAGLVLSIYNRWGELLHQTDKPFWDGNYRDKPCQSGYYTWQIKLPIKISSSSQKLYTRTGQVLLIR